jgi:ankyrin repeat protein
MGTRGIVILLVTACALVLTLESGFSEAIWRHNRDSGLFVLIGLIAFAGALVSMFWAIAFPISVMGEWNRLRRQQNFDTTKGSMRSPVSPVQPVAADNTVSVNDQNVAKPVLRDQQLPVQRKTSGSAAPFLGHLPTTVGVVGAVIGMIVSISVAEGARVITLTGQLAGLGFMIGYPVGALSRAAILRWSKSRQPEGAPVTSANELSAMTPLHRAASKGEKGVVEQLLASKADINCKTQGGLAISPLHYAVLNGHKAIAELLLTNGAEVNARGKGGETPLYFAAGEGNKDIAEMLLAGGAQVDAGTSLAWTPLLFAAMKGHRDVCELLLRNNADVNTRAGDGLTPLHTAAHAGRPDVVELLLSNQAHVNAKLTKEGSAGCTPLHYAALNGHKKIGELLLASGADVNANYGGVTPLHHAAMKGHREMAELLLANGADVNSRADAGATPLRMAGHGGHKEVADLLRQHGGHE